MNIEEYIASGILESYALGETTEQENALLECLVKTNPSVAEELRLIQDSFELFAKKEAITPPSELKEQIWAKISKESQKEVISIKVDNTVESEFPEVKKATSAKIIKMNWLNIAASLILILTSSSFALYYYFKNTEMNQQIAALNSNSQELISDNNLSKEYLAFLSHKETEKVTLAGVPSKPNAKALVFWNKENKHVMLSNIELPKAPSNKQYQLWALVDGKPVDAGMIELNSSKKLMEMKTIDNTQAFAITLEPMGGSASPHLEDLCVIGSLK